MSVAVAAPRGCSRCSTPLEDGDLRCCVCALPIPPTVTTIERARSQILRCTECGAAVGFDANKQAPACAFCGAVMKVEQPVDPVEVANRRIPFAVDRARAEAGLRTWLAARGFFAPKTLSSEAVLESLQPLCWAAWMVDAQAAISWTADSDAGSQRSDWAPHSGVFSERFDNITVPATRGLTMGECVQLIPHYDVARIVPADAPRQGVDAEAVIESFDAQRSAGRAQVMRGIEHVAAARVERVVPGSRVRNVRVSVLLELQVTDRVALPAWVLAYRFRGSPYRAVVHGQDASVVFGTSPTDWGKVMLVVAGVLLAVAAVVALIAALS